MAWFTIFLKIFFLLTPFFVISSFISMTAEYSPARRRITALKMTLAIIIVCLVLFWFGTVLFGIFGITLNSFRIGTGALLMLSAVSLVRGSPDARGDKDGEISVVPLAIPIAVGPGTIGALMVLSAEPVLISEKILSLSAVAAAGLLTGLLCLLSELVRRVLGVTGLAVLSKLTGLVIAAIAAQLVVAGIKGSFGIS
ncbi:MAG: MarC family protein [Spirochaetes bacterium]|nr:MarC family protein [Spirochaetota bacterium]